MNILTDSDLRTYAIIGATMEVHRQLGCGFRDHQEAFAIELGNRTIPYSRELKFPISFEAAPWYLLPPRLHPF